MIPLWKKYKKLELWSDFSAHNTTILLYIYILLYNYKCKR